MGLETVILAVIIGTLFAIVYSMRILVLMERRISRIDVHIEALVTSVLAEEKKIESDEQLILKQEEDIERALGIKVAAPAKKAVVSKKKKTARRA
jgi:hypothetical protein